MIVNSEDNNTYCKKKHLYLITNAFTNQLKTENQIS